MNPVFSKGKGEGIGYSYDRFLNQFLNICNDHLDSNRAKAFAFILYDFHDDHIREILNIHGIFTQLDRLSGKDLSIFYLDSEQKPLLESFNKIFLGAFEIENKYKKPFVLFFNINDNEVENVEIVELEQTDLVFSFKELYDNIQNYIARNKDNSIVARSEKNKLHVFLKTVKRISLEKIIELLIEAGAN